MKLRLEARATFARERNAFFTLAPLPYKSLFFRSLDSELLGSAQGASLPLGRRLSY